MGLYAQVSKNYSGTVTHMPPELIEDGKVYPQGDVYAFGIMMWEVSHRTHTDQSQAMLLEHQGGGLLLPCALPVP